MTHENKQLKSWQRKAKKEDTEYARRKMRSKKGIKLKN